MVLIMGGSAAGTRDIDSDEEIEPSPNKHGAPSKWEYAWVGAIPVGLVLLRHFLPESRIVFQIVYISLAVIQLYIFGVASYIVFKWPPSDTGLPTGLTNIHAVFNVAMFGSMGYTLSTMFDIVAESHKYRRAALLVEGAAGAVVSALMGEMALDDGSRWTDDGALEPVGSSSDDFKHAYTSMVVVTCVAAVSALTYFTVLIESRPTKRLHAAVTNETLEADRAQRIDPREVRD